MSARSVVLLHGLGRTSASMRPLERALVGRGYRVLNVDYPSRSADVDTLARHVATHIAGVDGSETFDVVTHSMGGIVLRVAVARGYLSAERIGRVVMLGPPNAGSELADILPAMPVVGPVYRRVIGPAGLQLGTGAAALPASLPPVEFELGVIAGDRSYNPLFSAILRGPSDGKVRVESTKVSGMTDFLVMPHWHPLLMAVPSVIAQAVHFLEAGAFRR
ncbi:MAG: alpha/beta fold hydrolase [Gemmatimonadaceae bacterium]